MMPVRMISVPADLILLLLLVSYYHAKGDQFTQLTGNVKCNKSLITRFPNASTTECHKCPICRRGQGSTVACGDVLETPKELEVKIRCKKCDKGFTFSPVKSNHPCNQCTICKPNHKVLKKCTRRKDTKCGGCKDDSYKDITGVFTTCEKCSLCCGDEKDQKVQECIDKGLPSHKVCSRDDAKRCKQKDPTIKSTLTGSSHQPTVGSRGITTSTSNSQTKHDPVIPTSPITKHSTEEPYAIYIHNSNNNRINTNSEQNELLIVILPTGLLLLVIPLMLVFLVKWLKRPTRGNRDQELGLQQRDNSSTEEPNESGSSLHQLQVEQQPLNDRSLQDSGNPNNGEQAQTVPTNVEQAQTVNLPTCSGQLDTDSETNTDNSCVSEEDSQSKQRQREEQSFSVKEWLDNTNTYSGLDSPYKITILTVNTLEEGNFISIVCGLGLIHLEAKQLYSNVGKGNFLGALEAIKTRKPNLKMEHLAKIFKQMGLNDLVALIREEDQRLAEEAQKQVCTRSTTVTAELENVDQCSTSANPE